MGWDINNYFKPTEPPERWNLRKKFMETHKEIYPEDRLVCLAEVFCNMEFIGCRYDKTLMDLVHELASQVEAITKYREQKISSIKRTFIRASDAVKKRSNESTCTDAKRFKTASQEDEYKTSFVSENVSVRDILLKSKQQPGWKGKIVIFEDLHCSQSAYTICANACMKAGLILKIIHTGNVKDLSREYALTIDSESIELCYAENEKKAREQLGQKVLDLFKKYCFTIVTKNKFDGEKIEKQQESNTTESSTLPENNIGTKMMKLMGWCGQGLGKNQTGIQNPIEVQENVNRLGLGGSKNCKNMIAQINKYLENYVRLQHTHSLVFSPDFTNDERKFIHEAARRLNLQSKSHGKGTNRQLTVQRKLSAWKIVEDLLEVGGSTNKYDLIKPTAV